MRGLAAAALAVSFALAACAPRGAAHRGSDRDVIETIASLHKAQSVGDYASVHRHIDYAYRLAEVLGPVWDAAPVADRDAAIALARGMWVSTTERYWTTHFEGRRHESRVSRLPDDPGARWVEVRTSDARTPRFAWMYRLHGGDGGTPWKITQREFRIGTIGSETSRFYPMALKRVGQTLGRTPTLAELNANLPSLIGRMKTRTITIPELPSRP